MRFPVYAVYFQGLACVTLPTFCLCQALSSEPGPPLQEVIVTATLRPIAALEVPASVTVLDAKLLQDAGQEDFEDVAALVPNLNWAGDTSRPRYFQIRGIGQLLPLEDAAERVGKLVAQRAIEKGVKDVVFDRGGYIFHGRIKALAEAAREAGLNF